MTEQDAAKLLTLIKASFPSFNLTESVESLWTRYLTTQTDYENASANLHEHILHEIFPPLISQIVRSNENIRAKQEKERTRMMIQESERLMLETSTVTPWEKEGISHKEYLHRILGESRGKKNAQS